MYSSKLLANTISFSTVIWMGISPSIATPITLQFEAEIATIIDHNMIDLGIDLNVGDRVTGQFSFKPQQGGGPGTNFIEFEQPFSGNVEINGASLTTSGVLFTSFNDSLVLFDCGPGAVCRPSGTYDIIQAFFGLGTVVTSNPSVSPEHSTWRLRLEGYQSFFTDSEGIFRTETAFEQPELPSDVSTWNALNTRRTLDIYLGNQSGQRVYVQAHVGDFQIVPEPSVCCMVFVLGTICTYLRWRK